jgi:hypothetical protein
MTNMTLDISNLFLVLEANHQSKEDWMILRDCLLDSEREQDAECILFMMDKEEKLQKRPYKFFDEESKEKGWHWFNLDRTQGEDDIQSNIPETLWKHLKRGDEILEGVIREYPSLQEACEDFFQTWKEGK